MVVDITSHTLPEVITFLERTPETSLFLLSNIRAFGTRLGDSPYSGKWSIARAIWNLLCGGGRVRETVASKEVMYRLDLSDRSLHEDTAPVSVRMLGPDDHDQWERLSADSLDAVGLPTLGERDQRRAGFVRSSGLGHLVGGLRGRSAGLDDRDHRAA